MGQPKLSTIVPVYNAEKTLNRCVDSILSQTYKNFELILVDDGSSDKSADICDEYQKTDNRIKVIHSKNGGVSHARNLGLDICSGEIVTFIDSDDYIEPDFFDEIVRCMAPDIDVAFFGIITEDNNKKIIKKVAPPNEVHKNCGEALSYIDITFVYGKSYRTDLIKKNALRFNEKYSLGEDTIFLINFLLKCSGGMKLSGENQYHYVIGSGDSLSIKYVPNIEEVFSEIYDLRKQLERKYPEYYKVYFIKEKLLAEVAIANLYRRNCNLPLRSKIGVIKKHLRNEKARNAIIKQKNVDNKDRRLMKVLFIIKSPVLFHIVYGSSVWLNRKMKALKK